MALYDKIGSSYDKSRCADPFISKRLYFHLHPDLNLRYLDIACGTGNYTIALQRLGLQISGIDQSIQMINIARQKDSSIKWFLGDVKELPFPNDIFSGATCILAIHHFTNLQCAFSEIARVMLKGYFVIFTATSEQMKRYWLNEYFPEAMGKSIRQMQRKSEIVGALKKAGFNKISFELYEIKEALEDFFLYSGKNHPEIYLDPRVRMNICTFAALAESDEVKRGCSLLDADIRSGRIHQVIDSYRLQIKGDYMFVIGRK